MILFKGEGFFKSNCLHLIESTLLELRFKLVMMTSLTITKTKLTRTPFVSQKRKKNRKYFVGYQLS